MNYTGTLFVIGILPKKLVQIICFFTAHTTIKLIIIKLENVFYNYLQQFFSSVKILVLAIVVKNNR